MKFNEFWKLQNTTDEEYLIKAKLTKSELVQIQDLIHKMQMKGLPSSKIIAALQKSNGKLIDKYVAERAYYTEVKSMETKTVARASEDLGFDTFKVMLSPHACPLCMKKSQNGNKIFKSNEVRKGNGEVPPFHPNCYCLLLPNA